jgi:hypothetical protein
MHENENLYSVSLVGGLGNQLFQYAHALSVGDEDKISLTEQFNYGKRKIRKNPSLLAFNVKNHKISLRLETNYGLKFKTHNLILRLSTARESSTRFFNTKRLIQNFVKFFAQKFVFRGFNILCQPSIGFFDGKIQEINTPTLQIGYFQHCAWRDVDRVMNTLNSLALVNPSNYFAEISQELESISFLAVHMRFGDYEQDNRIGILPSRYFMKSIDWQINRFTYDEIILFTNDEKRARGYISQKFDLKVRIISELSSLSDLETFELMRRAKGYVIANSTFSWWSAFLSSSENPSVVYPKPWFQGMNDPERMFPQEWQQIEID